MNGGCPGVPVHGGIPIVFISTQFVNVSFLCVPVHEDTTPWMGDIWNTLTVLVFLNNTIIHIHTVIISNLFPGWYIFWNKEAEYGCKPCPCQQSISLHNKRVIFCLIKRWKSDTLVYCINIKEINRNSFHLSYPMLPQLKVSSLPSRQSISQLPI